MDTREPCQYGSSCYRRNKEHLNKFNHPPKEKKQQAKISVEKGNLKQQKLSIFFKTDSKIDDEARRKRRRSGEVEQPICSSESCDEMTSLAEGTHCEPESVANDDNDDFTSETSKSEAESTKSETKNPKTKTQSKFTEISKPESNRIIKKILLVDMPEDFYDFWEFCKTLSPESPQDALDPIDLQLVGPFDVFTGAVDEHMDLSAALRHWRYYYDPPEFQTVIRSTKTDSFHIGYFRDEPHELPVFVASNYASKNATITPVAENLFGAVEWCLKEFEKSATPFKKVKSSNFKTELLNWAKKKEYCLGKSTEKIRARDRKVVARTFHHAGIVVPYDKKTEVGYRPLAETSNNLTKLLKQIDDSKTEDERKIYFGKLYEIVTWANIAMDEGDYGTCLELGLDLFSYGSQHLHKVILQVLTPAYNLLGRSDFSTILKAHLEDRKKGNILSAK